MKKNLIASIISLLCLLNASDNIFAAQLHPLEPVLPPDSQDVQAKYAVDSSYSVIIPAEINFSAINVDINEVIGANNVLIETGSSLKISMSSLNSNLTNGSSFIPYSFTINNASTQIEASMDYELLTIESGNRNGKNQDIVFTATSLDNVIVSGLHSDTLTFKVNVTPPTLYMQTINDDIKNSIISGDITSLVDSRDNKEYSVVPISGNIWMKQNLNYNASDDNTTWDDGIYYSEAYDETYYTWSGAATSDGGNASDTASICPSGWRLPIKDDLESLMKTLILIRGGSIEVVTEQIKDGIYAGYAGSINPSEIYDYGNINTIWTSTPYVDDNGVISSNYHYVLDFDNDQYGGIGASFDNFGYSVRCIAR